ncbi:hypothetical protein MKX01_002742 [Papaver californicum]|nr:hypothetical protein MKX01_002742 [Papaver californicum]
MELLLPFLNIFLSLIVLILSSCFIHLYRILVLKPKTLRSKLLKQGINGPAPSSFLYGNVPDMKTIHSTAVKVPIDERSVKEDHLSSLFPYFEQWRNEYDIRVDLDLRSFSADVISKACFGSSYNKGKEIFTKIRALQELMAKQGLFIGIPGSSYLPTKNNKKIWRLEKEISGLILKVVKQRREAKTEKDLLQMILEGANNESLRLQSTDQFIVDNCKNIYFAGFETTATSASWILMLLATHPEWQTRVRTEVSEICEGFYPDFNMLRKMKLLTMVIQETLRLHPPAMFVSREAFKDVTIGDINVPKGVAVWLPLVTLHRDPKLWGPDAGDFNPDRWLQGTAGACTVPQVYMPFGVGPRICLGQNFAVIELKIILSLILSKFSFTLSPQYRHSPACRLTLEPEYGVDLIVSKI